MSFLFKSSSTNTSANNCGKTSLDIGFKLLIRMFLPFLGFFSHSSKGLPDNSKRSELESPICLFTPYNFLKTNLNCCCGLAPCLFVLEASGPPCKLKMPASINFLTCMYCSFLSPCVILINIDVYCLNLSVSPFAFLNPDCNNKW
ncbi:hypothetical protein D3C85_322690 [compost metagenome]